MVLYFLDVVDKFLDEVKKFSDAGWLDMDVFVVANRAGHLY